MPVVLLFFPVGLHINIYSSQELEIHIYDSDSYLKSLLGGLLFVIMIETKSRAIATQKPKSSHINYGIHNKLLYM